MCGAWKHNCQDVNQKSLLLAYIQIVLCLNLTETLLILRAAILSVMLSFPI